MRLPLLFVALLPVLMLGGCSLLPEQIDETADWSASEFHANAKEALADSEYERALELYGKLEARYPYGPYAEQAQLETAYAHYKANEPEAAVAAAERFIKLHPRHSSVDYAYYLRGLASFKVGGGLLDSIAPPEPEKHDPAGARRAFGYFRELVERFPNSRYSGDAKQRMTFLRNLLARHELHVADQYYRRGAWLAAVNRARYVLENYRQTPAVADALALMVRGYRQLEMPQLAADTLRILQLNYADHPALQQLQTSLPSPP